MKTLKIKRAKKLMLMAFGILAIIAGMAFATGGVKGLAYAAAAPGIVIVAGKEEKLSEKEQAILDAIDAKIAKINTDAQKGLVSETTLEAKVKEINAEYEKLSKAMEEQGMALRKAQVNKEGIKSWRQQIYDQLSSPEYKAWADEAQKTKGRGVKGFELEMKVAITMLESAGSATPAYYLPIPEYQPGVVAYPRPRPVIIQSMDYGGTNSQHIVWIEKQNPQGNAAATAEGAAIPLISSVYKANSSSAKKIPATTKISLEMINDIEFMMAQVQGELKIVVDLQADKDALTGTGVDPILKGVTVFCGAMVNTGLGPLQSNNPTVMDAILAARAQIENSYFMPNVVFLNPTDKTAIKTAKDNLGQYLYPQFVVSDKEIDGLTVITTPLVTAGYFLIGDSSKFHVREYKPFSITIGWENDDFTKDLVSLVGERRLHTWMADNETASFIYDTFATVQGYLKST